MTAGLCPALVWLITNSNDTPVSTNIFTANVPGATLSTYQTDRTYAQTYHIKLSAKYTGTHYSNTGSTVITYTVVDPCLTATLTLTPATQFFSD